MISRTICKNIYKTSSLNELLDDFQCKGIDELIIKRKTIENGLKDKEKFLGILRGQILSLAEDIKIEKQT